MVLTWVFFVADPMLEVFDPDDDGETEFLARACNFSVLTEEC